MENTLEQRTELELKLSNKDYRAIKLFEATLDFLLTKYPELNKDLPYDFEQFKKERDDIRDEINKLD